MMLNFTPASHRWTVWFVLLLFGQLQNSNATTPIWQYDQTTTQLHNGVGNAEDVRPAIFKANSGTLLLTWKSTDSLNDTIGADSDLLYRRSTDMGKTWNPTKTLNLNAAEDGLAVDQHPTFCTTGNGDIFCAWSSSANLDSEPDSHKITQIVVSRSMDDGASWGNIDPILQNGSAAENRFDINPNLIALDENNIVIFWERTLQSQNDERTSASRATPYDFYTITTETDNKGIMYSYSNDAGISWTSPDFYRESKDIYTDLYTLPND